MLIALMGAWLAPSTALACSGPKAMETIVANGRIGMLCWLGTLITVGVGTVILRRRKQPWRSLWPLALLAAAHPGLWMSTTSGDCGYTLRDSSIGVALLTLLLVAVLLWRTRNASKETTESHANT